MAIKPIFMLSLPRSGSTLVQRVLSTYPEVASSSEPWMLLPFLSPLEREMPLATGWQASVNEAFRDFVDGLPGGDEDYFRALRPLAEQLYERAAGDGARYFLDKTPPYHWIADQIFRLFPDAKFVFLWRNPLSVVSSVIETFCDGRWRPDRFRGTLEDGPRSLLAAYRANAEQSIGVRFEDLVGPDGPRQWERLTDYLELEFDPDSLTDFQAVNMTGRLGDPTGIHRYSTLSSEPLEKWRATIRNPVRRRWCERYLRQIGARDLREMGYDLERLLAELRQGGGGGGGMLADSVDLTRSLTRGAAREALSIGRR